MPPISRSEARAQVRLRLAWHGHLYYFLVVHSIFQQILLPAVSILESPPNPFWYLLFCILCLFCLSYSLIARPVPRRPGIPQPSFPRHHHFDHCPQPFNSGRLRLTISDVSGPYFNWFAIVDGENLTLVVRFAEPSLSFPIRSAFTPLYLRFSSSRLTFSRPSFFDRV